MISQTVALVSVAHSSLSIYDYLPVLPSDCLSRNCSRDTTTSSVEESAQITSVYEFRFCDSVVDVVVGSNHSNKRVQFPPLGVSSHGKDTTVE
ncbi:calcineurin-like phosphoesterase [Anopheles sinensis]|uniref:Calcineurin-like phosphoesterase n=1 Tax=Anopheles sinensis TaxID=74873 RepID=A0A084VBF9_ANOSI|nr:calcineurin-like phosphoesterase [Anopheles sinensis]